MKILQRSLTLLAAVAFFAGFAAPVLAQNDDEPMTIPSFAADITVNKDSTVDVNESIKVEFNEERHGIYRDIPVDYVTASGQRQSIVLVVHDVTDENGTKYSYTTSRLGADEEIKIGDADQLITGEHIYNIRYSVNRVLLNLADQDQLYWNVTGEAWEAPMQHVTATIHLPFADQSKIQTACYTGPDGSKAQDCAQQVGVGEATFSAHDFLTVAVGWPIGAVVRPSASTKFWWFVQDNSGYLYPLLALLIFYPLWSRYGRDPKGKGIVRQYDAPAGLTPMMVAQLASTRKTKAQIPAEIVYLAVKGCLKIVETEKKGFLHTTTEYRLKKIKDAPADAPTHLKTLFAKLFDDGDTLELADLPDDFYATAQTVTGQATLELNGFNYFDLASQKRAMWAGIATAIVGAVIIIGGFNAERVDQIIGGILATAIMAFFAWNLSNKTEEGVAAMQYAQGFRAYIAAAEVPRTKWQENNNYFFDVLPYAMVFGLVDKWTEAMKAVNLPPPQWFVSANPALFATNFSRSMNGFAATTASHTAPPASSSGGLGGGGSSGGGFGGGGGGSW